MSASAGVRFGAGRLSVFHVDRVVPMNEFKRILLPTDFGAGADQALQHAVALAGQSGATLHVLHAVDRDRHSMLEFPLMEELIDRVHRAIARVDQRLSEDEAVERPRVRLAVRAHEDPARCILEYVADYQIDLVIMSPIGQRRNKRPGLGSTAEKVARLAPCDVLTTGRRHGPGPAAAKRILVPIDFSAESRIALERARQVAAQTSGRLTVLHVQTRSVFPSKRSEGTSIELITERTRTQEDVARFYRQSKGPDVPHRFRLERGNPAGRIASYAESHDIHLIVQGSRSLPGMQYAMLGSVAEGVVRYADCAVLTVKAESATRVASFDEVVQPEHTRAPKMAPRAVGAPETA